jgi:hypothetical protein
LTLRGLEGVATVTILRQVFLPSAVASSLASMSLRSCSSPRYLIVAARLAGSSAGTSKCEPPVSRPSEARGSRDQVKLGVDLAAGPEDSTLGCGNCPPHSGVRLNAAVVPNFIEPPGEQPPTGPDWVHEIKHDGFRLMARRGLVGIRLERLRATAKAVDLLDGEDLRREPLKPQGSYVRARGLVDHGYK